MDEFEQLHHNLTNHAPSDSMIPRFEGVRGAAKDLGSVILTLCPPSRERSLALTQLEQTVMWAVASIARS